MATLGLFSLAATSVAFGYLYLRRRYTIDPHSAYRLAMYRLNTHPGLLEVGCRCYLGSANAYYGIAHGIVLWFDNRSTFCVCLFLFPACR